jgi:N utilization substance protein A
MDIDLSVLRSLENEKDISSETALKAIEDALLMAYHKTEGANPASRVEVNRTTGHVTVWARMDGAAGEAGADGVVGREYDDCPAGDPAAAARRRG